MGNNKNMKYDPNKKWTWLPEDKFEMTGEEFGLILNSYRAILSSPEAQRILLIQRANDVIENIIAKAVENDVVKEIKE